MVNLNNNGSSFYTTKITFIDNGEEKEVYTDNPSIYEIMFNTDKTRFLLVYQEVVKPTEDQVKRLKILNDNSKGQEVEGFGEQINLFVQYGYVDSTCPVYLDKYRSEYKESSKNYLLSKYKKLLSAYKSNKEQDGCLFMDQMVKTDEASQAKITGTLVMMNTGALDTIDFKTATGWLTLNKEAFTKLALTVASHVQVCFSTENSVMNTLKDKSLEELIKLNPTTTQSLADRDKAPGKTIYDLYEETYTSFLTAAQKAQLAKLKGK